MAVGWDAAAVVARWPGLAPLAGAASADACVIGLGASGLAAVEALVDRGLSVIGVDAGRVAAGAAGRNGGFLLGGPEPCLHDAIADWVPVRPISTARRSPSSTPWRRRCRRAC